jgi:two-component system, NtrC family, sensor kinase
MTPWFSRYFSRLPLRWKLQVVVLPLVLLPFIVVGVMTGYIAYQQAYRGITNASRDDLDHLCRFAIDLLDSHYKQFQVYRDDKKKTVQEEMRTITNLAYSLVETEQRHYQNGRLGLQAAKLAAAKALKTVNIGETGYIYAMNSKGQLLAHIAREGENIYDEQDEDGRYFIRDICRAAVASAPGEVLYAVYPWRNTSLGDQRPRRKLVAYRYFREWDWIIATGGYLDETYEDSEFEKRSFAELKNKINSKRVGKTGYIYCLDTEGTLTLHPESAGQNILEMKDAEGQYVIKRMLASKNGWARYAWQNIGDAQPRMKIVRYLYYKPWQWIVAVGSYEDEFYQEANEIKHHLWSSLIILGLTVGLISVGLVFTAATAFTEPIHAMTSVIRRVKAGRLELRMQVDSKDELGELASHFNRMTDLIKQHREMESNLAQQGKMASLGVLASGVAHEINNPLGVILGYAAYLEGKLDKEDPMYGMIHDIKQESKRCKKIVQDLLSYARTPKPVLERTDVNALLNQIVDFAANHTAMHNVVINREFSADLPSLMVDGDQLRQVAINLMLNAGSAMPDGGVLTVRSERVGDRVVLSFADTGVGIESENLENIFEPFFTTRKKGTGLGLAITRQIVRHHQGNVEVDSQPGQGTTMRVWLPLPQEVEGRDG